MTAVWDERLISRARAYDMTAHWKLDQQADRTNCGECGLFLFPGRGSITLDEIVPRIVRHITVQHGVSLKGSADE